MILYEAYVYKQALDAALDHAKTAAGQGLEAMGLFIGQPYTYQGTPYTLVHHYVTAPNNSTAVSVRFSPQAISQLAQQYARHHKGKLITGWCHSHPSYGCFLSQTDVNTQRRFFSEPWHVAMVIDPLSKQGNSPLYRMFKLEGSTYRECSFAIIEPRS